MANQRMANSDEFNEELSKAQRRERGRERIANDPSRMEERLSSVDRDKYDMKGFSDKDIVMAYQGGDFGDEDYARLTGKPAGGGEDDSGGGNDGGGNDTPTPTPAPTPTPSPTPGPGITPYPGPSGPPDIFGSNSQTQTVNQDNDINSTVNGDNNTVTNVQDNSISQSMGSSEYSTRYARGLKDQYVLNLMNR